MSSNQGQGPQSGVIQSSTGPQSAPFKTPTLRVGITLDYAGEMSDPEKYPVIRRVLLTRGVMLSNAPIVATFRVENATTGPFLGGRATVTLAGPTYLSGKPDALEVPRVEPRASVSFDAGNFYALREGVHWLSLEIKNADGAPVQLEVPGGAESTRFSHPISIANLEMGFLLEYLARSSETPLGYLPGLRRGDEP
jgi:hypothetical protein